MADIKPPHPTIQEHLIFCEEMAMVRRRVLRTIAIANESNLPKSYVTGSITEHMEELGKIIERRSAGTISLPIPMQDES